VPPPGTGIQQILLFDMAAWYKMRERFQMKASRGKAGNLAPFQAPDKRRNYDA